MIEQRLKEELDIPVMHDDQHGTAIISAAALLNALELANKKIEAVKNCSFWSWSCSHILYPIVQSLWCQGRNIVMTDSKGVIRKDRENLTTEKAEFATARDVTTLAEALENADVFIGLSMANIVDEAMLRSMANNPIVFAMANPDPEINYDVACSVRDDIIMATGRSEPPQSGKQCSRVSFYF